MNKNTRMRHFTLIGILCLLASFTTSAQSVRTVTGVQNNQQYPSWGAANTTLRRLAPPAYADGISSPGGTDRPNPRRVSNEIFAQSGLINDPMNLSDFCWVWGQFIDHDLTLVLDQPNAWNFISVPAGDPWMDPFNTGQAIIPMLRSQFAPGTGIDASNPAQHRNAISAFLDAGNVYGSDVHRAEWLRTHSGGKLKTSAGNLLPYNTTTGEYDDPIDHDAPEMDDAVGMSPKLFVAGDVRANENVLLISIHTLFVREHNRLCDELALAHPTWTDEELYQHAKRKVNGYMAAILYEQWLPDMGVHLAPYTGYDWQVNPTITNMFSAAAFRLGHTLLNSNINVMDNDGNDAGSMLLRDAYFNPTQVAAAGGIDPFLKGMGAQMQQACDSKMVDDVRNFLFGPPGAGGLDLAAINIARGRERGIPAFNEVRSALGLAPVTYITSLTTDVTVQNKLISLYGGDVAKLDPWVGMLIEAPMPGALFGETIMAAMVQQFTALRDGDRFYYENDPALSAAEKAEIKGTMFRDIIQRNTGITLMQEDVFLMMPHEMLCGAATTEADITGSVTTELGMPINGVNLTIVEQVNNTALFDGQIDGDYALLDAPTCEAYALTFDRTDEITNGVTALDIVALRKHILNLDLLTVPERLIAADLNASGSLSTLDIVQMRKAILGLITEWDHVPTWRFFAADTTLPSNTDALLSMATDFGAVFTIANLSQTETLNLRGVKMGDLNGSVDVSNVGGGTVATEGRTAEAIILSLSQTHLAAGETARIMLRADRALAAYQGTLRYDADQVSLLSVQPVAGSDFGTANYYHRTDEAALSFVYDHLPTRQEDRLFVLELRAETDVDDLLDAVWISTRYTPDMAVDSEGEAHPLALTVSAESDVATAAAVLYQNQPNPVGDRTTVRYYLAEPGAATLRLLDATGRELERTENIQAAGYHTWELDASVLESGLYFYQLQTATAKQTRKMVVR